MLWYKSWLETRSRFLIGLILLMGSAIGVVYTYPQVLKLMPLVPNVRLEGEVGRRVMEMAELSREYRGFIWAQWYRQNLPQIWTIFAVLLALGGLFAQGSKGALFTLSLPASRNRIVGIRAATGLAELFIITLVPALLLPLLSPAIGQTYRLSDAVVHTLCLFIGGATFYSLAFLLSTAFNDIWRPLLIALGVAIVLGLCEQIPIDLARYGIFHVMSGEVYFRTGGLPWVGLLTTAALSAAMLYGAAVNTARRDF
jgi:ABC-2 type transport system permease protein